MSNVQLKAAAGHCHSRVLTEGQLRRLLLISRDFSSLIIRRVRTFHLSPGMKNEDLKKGYIHKARPHFFLFFFFSFLQKKLIKGSRCILNILKFHPFVCKGTRSRHGAIEGQSKWSCRCEERCRGSRNAETCFNLHFK